VHADVTGLRHDARRTVTVGGPSVVIFEHYSRVDVPESVDCIAAWNPHPVTPFGGVRNARRQPKLESITPRGRR
jgi:hypothetical protein